MHNQLSRYISSLRCAERTRIEYSNDLRAFLKWAATKHIASASELTAAAIEEYIGTLRRQDGARYAIPTQNRVLSAIKGFCHFLTKARLFSEDPSISIRTQRQYRRAPVFLEVPDGARMLAALRKRLVTGFEQERDIALLALMLGSGLRVSEISQLNVGAWHSAMQSGWLTIIGKGSKERIVPPSDEAVGFVQAYLRVRPQTAADSAGEPLFVSRNHRRLSIERIEQLVRELAKQVGIAKRITPHRLRATWVTHLLISGANPREVQAMAGHESLDTTMLYAGVRKNEELRQTIRKHQINYTV